MDRPAPLPLPLNELPANLRRFCDPAAPLPARTLAARGAVPLGGSDQIMLLLQLAADGVESIAATARESLQRVPEAVLHAAAEAPIPPAFLEGLAHSFTGRIDVLERVVGNPATADGTVAMIAATCPERVSERISVNEQRLLGAPQIIEALYRNKNTRMSTADRLIELAVRRGVRVDIPAFDALAQTIRGQGSLNVEPPSETPSPADLAFAQVLRDDRDDPDVTESDPNAPQEAVKQNFLPLMMQIRTMSVSQKLRLALVGSASARALLVRDKSKLVANAAISSPAVNENEVVPIARSKETGEDILRYIGNKREWTKNYEVRYALMFNPKVPPGISLRFISYLRDGDLKDLSRSKNVPAAVRSAAMQKIQIKERKEKGGK